MLTTAAERPGEATETPLKARRLLTGCNAMRLPGLVVTHFAAAVDKAANQLGRLVEQV
jgi:hypothetical protein